jgi:hypothetical protein
MSSDLSSLEGTSDVGRRIIYKIRDDKNSFTDQEWEEVQGLQHWYNSEFSWSTGKIAFKRYIIFPNTEEFYNLDQTIWQIIDRRRTTLREQGLSQQEIIVQLEKDRLVFVKWGGNYDNCLASGFTRVADNEWNAFLVCDFLLKASTLCPGATIQVFDEGQFIKTGAVWLRNGAVLLPKHNLRTPFVEEILQDRRIFSIVNPTKYSKHPAFKNIIPDFNRKQPKERRSLVQNWNWLGYGDGYDSQGDDLEGYDLNAKARDFLLAD